MMAATFEADGGVMQLARLRALIARAIAHEQKQHTLERSLAERLHQFHPCIRLPNGNAPRVLTEFTIAYIEDVPMLLDAANTVARQAGIDHAVKPVLKVAEQFFLKPPVHLDGHEGLYELLDEAYLAHRLVEEVNDRYITHFGRPLIPRDTTRANLIAHQLIGEDFANQLDELVHNSVAKLLPPETFQKPSVQRYREKICAPNTIIAWLRWPCMSRELGLDVDFSE